MYMSKCLTKASLKRAFLWPAVLHPSCCSQIELHLTAATHAVTRRGLSEANSAPLIHSFETSMCTMQALQVK